MTLGAMLERVELGSCGLLERGMNGVRRGKGARTTVPAKDGRRAGDLLDRDFTAPAANIRWVADFTYCRTWAGSSTSPSSSTCSPS
jgi:transposase InsO family protein